MNQIPYIKTWTYNFTQKAYFHDDGTQVSDIDIEKALPKGETRNQESLENILKSLHNKKIREMQKNKNK